MPMLPAPPMPRIRPAAAACLCAVTWLIVASSAVAQQVAVREITLDNGMQFLLVPRKDQPNVVSAGWVARVGRSRHAQQP